jgi:hypothetical protein
MYIKQYKRRIKQEKRELFVLCTIYILTKGIKRAMINWWWIRCCCFLVERGNLRQIQVTGIKEKSASVLDDQFRKNKEPRSRSISPVRVPFVMFQQPSLVIFHLLWMTNSLKWRFFLYIHHFMIVDISLPSNTRVNME